MEFEKYPFEKLEELLRDIEPNKEFTPLVLTIGEPQFKTPEFIVNELRDKADLINRYPKTSGEEFLKEAILDFVKRRFDVELSINQLLLTFGTREVLFNFPAYLLSSKDEPKMAFTNPFYQIYEGAAKAARAKIKYLNLTKENGFKPKIDDSLKEMDFVIINSPNNPTVSVMSKEELKEWVEAAVEYDFVLLNDECYSEIYTSKLQVHFLRQVLVPKMGGFTNILVVKLLFPKGGCGPQGL